jgi:hypothetical protein
MASGQEIANRVFAELATMLAGTTGMSRKAAAEAVANLGEKAYKQAWEASGATHLGNIMETRYSHGRRPIQHCMRHSSGDEQRALQTLTFAGGGICVSGNNRCYLKLTT